MRRLLISLSISCIVAPTLGAQAYNYPALQTPRVVEREYNFAAASASRAGTSLVFQWREELQPLWQFTFDGGLAAPRTGGDTRVILGAGVAWQAARSSDDFPFDVAVTGGVGFSSGGIREGDPGIAYANALWRVPIGAAVGHTFDLDQGLRLTPFAHPRLSWDHCSACRGGGAPNSRLSVDVDVGADFVATPQVSLRLAALLGGSEYAGGTTSVALSVAWTPKGLRK